MRQRLLLSLAVTSLVGGAGALVLTPAQAATPALKFGHQVVLDHQRSGFEPDVVIDSKGSIYSSVPNGSAQGESFIWKSYDRGDSFQLVPGNVAFGKPATCLGGGDTELAKDSGDNLYLSDLQNLTNLSNSVSTDGGLTFNASCTSAPNTPVDRMWFASHGKLGDPDFAIYEEYDAVLSGADPNAPVSNQLVETVSHDGATFTPVINGAPSTACLGGGAVNCVTNEEGLPGNQILNKKGQLVIAHSGQDGNKILASVGTLTTTGTGQAAVTTAIWKDVVVNGDICPDKTTAAGICGSANFPTVAIDSAGNVYMVYASQEVSGSTPKGPYNVYVNVSKDGGLTWGKSRKVSSGGSNAFPWLTAGSSGRVAVAWYHANEEGERNKFAFDDLTKASFDVQVAQSIDALAASPHYSIVTATEHPMKYGPICTAGTTCAATMGDRSLGDYLNLGVDPTDGSLVLLYVDDTSNSFTTGPTGAVAENGPPVMQRQIGGASMIAGKAPSRTALPFDHVTDPTSDAFYNANSLRTAGSTNLDVVDSKVTEDAAGLVVTMKVANLEDLTVLPTLGGTTGEWFTRFTTYNPATPGNGHIYYVGMESIAGQAPRFFVGDVAAPNPAALQISMVFDSATAVPGAYTGAGTITWHVPYSAVPGLRKGALMYSVTSFTATTTATLQGSPQTVFNVIDASAPYDHVAGKSGAPRTVRPPVVAPVVGRPTSNSGGGGLAATGGLGWPLAALVLLGLGGGLLVVRRRLA